MQLFAGIGGLLGGGGMAAGGAMMGGAGILSTILQGTATVMGVMSSIQAGKQEAAALNLQAQDAEREQALETLQGIDRRQSIKKAMNETQGAINNAYAASGLDLSFGTVAQARQELYRDADYETTKDVGTQLTRNLRLSERAANYRAAAKRAKRAGVVNGLIGGLQGAVSILDRFPKGGR